MFPGLRAGAEAPCLVFVLLFSSKLSLLRVQLQDIDFVAQLFDPCLSSGLFPLHYFPSLEASRIPLCSGVSFLVRGPPLYLSF